MADAATRIHLATSQLQDAVVELRATLRPPCVGEACAKLRERNARLLHLLRTHPAGPPPRPAMLAQRRLRIAAKGAWKCAICGQTLVETFAIDHVTQWADSYDDSDDNLRALCCGDHTHETSVEHACRSRVRSQA